MSENGTAMREVPPKWSANTAETTTVLSRVVHSLGVSTVLREIADLLDSDDGLILLSVYDCGLDHPDHPGDTVVQAIFTRVNPEQS